MLMGAKFPRDLGSDFSAESENDRSEDFEESEDFWKTGDSEKTQMAALRDFRKREEIRNAEKPESVNPADRMPDSDIAGLAKATKTKIPDSRKTGKTAIPQFPRIAAKTKNRKGRKIPNQAKTKKTPSTMIPRHTTDTTMAITARKPERRSISTHTIPDFRHPLITSGRKTPNTQRRIRGL